MRRRLRWLVALAIAFAAATLSAHVVSAHPLGNFTVNHYSGIEVAGRQVRIHYVLDLAEIPAFQERQRTESSPRHLDDRIEGIARNLRLAVDGTRLPLRLIDRRLRFLPGQAGLQTLRIEALLTADVPAGGEHSALYRDDNDPGRLGWREITVRAADAARILRSDAPARSLTNELRTYPQDMLNSPLDVMGADFTFSPGTAGARAVTLGPIGSRFSGVQDRLAALIVPDRVSWPLVGLALVAALGLGAAHALSPGHGKAVVAGYMVGPRSSWRHAILLGASITVTHTAGVFAFGLVTLYASSLVTPEQLYPWLTLTSGLLVLLMGAWLVFARSRAARRGRVRGHVHDHAGGHDHDDASPHGRRESVGRRSVVLLGVSGGLLPCPSALIVLVAAISLHRLAFGLLLILAFSTGLAAVLVGIGLVVSHGTSLLGRVPRHAIFTATCAARVLPVGSALVVCLVGIGLLTQGLHGIR